MAKPVRVGILSMGDMGANIGHMLVAHGIPVFTNCQGRSQATMDRARSAGVTLLDSDVALVKESDVIISIVPPRDAEATAKRIIDAVESSHRSSSDTLYFGEFNAVSPATCKRIAALFRDKAPAVRFIDGCILGGPPKRKEQSSSASVDTATAGDEGGSSFDDVDRIDEQWDRPRIPVSGPHALAEATSFSDGEKLARVLNLRQISPDIGPASGLKMCFASMAKGFTALATQTFTAAHRMGVLDELRREMATGQKVQLGIVERMVPHMPPKAYRWVKEMEEISDTFRDLEEGGGWGVMAETGTGVDMLAGAAEVYRAVAEDEVLGKETIGNRKRGRTIDDVAELLGEGLARRKQRRGD